MRDGSFDRTVERNSVHKWRFPFKEGEQAKAGRSETFASVGASPQSTKCRTFTAVEA